ncbi:unnamed protein product [Psylliodes chrysocephalus]|uniref:HAT C-terminal dimerisation domain-containing protein n=1 Tax=Psylliodes chrysocephalus TaxID=3402493 RepID=A0A9P0D3C8_9CUCU|nr:unnamed protein product [Psylliodes chrysocephala]
MKNVLNVYRRSNNFNNFSCLDLETGILPTLDQLIDLWLISPWKQEPPPENMYEELAALQTVFPALEGKTVDMWCTFFRNEAAANLLKIVQYVCSIPIPNAFVEWIFSVVGSNWTDERNRLSLESVKSELCVFFNINSSCTEFKDYISAASNAKYFKK